MEVTTISLSPFLVEGIKSLNLVMPRIFPFNNLTSKEEMRLILSI